MAGDNLAKTEQARHKFILGFGFLAIVAVLLLSPYTLLVHAQQTQEQLFIQIFGAGADHWIANLAGAISQGTGLVQAADRAHGFLGARLDVIDLGLYIVAWRVIYAGMALVLSAPLLLAAIYDGMVRRRISQWRYEYTSNRRHYMARVGAGFFLDALLLLVFLPLPLSPVVVAIVLVIFGMSLRAWAASIQKRI